MFRRCSQNQKFYKKSPVSAYLFLIRVCVPLSVFMCVDVASENSTVALGANGMKTWCLFAAIVCKHVYLFQKSGLCTHALFSHESNMATHNICEQRCCFELRLFRKVDVHILLILDSLLKAVHTDLSFRYQILNQVYLQLLPSESECGVLKAGLWEIILSRLQPLAAWNLMKGVPLVQHNFFLSIQILPYCSFINKLVFLSKRPL